MCVHPACEREALESIQAYIHAYIRMCMNTHTHTHTHTHTTHTLQASTSINNVSVCLLDQDNNKPNRLEFRGQTCLSLLSRLIVAHGDSEGDLYWSNIVTNSNNNSKSPPHGVVVTLQACHPTALCPQPHHHCTGAQGQDASSHTRTKQNGEVHLHIQSAQNTVAASRDHVSSARIQEFAQKRACYDGIWNSLSKVPRGGAIVPQQGTSKVSENLTSTAAAGSTRAWGTRKNCYVRPSHHGTCEVMVVFVGGRGRELDGVDVILPKGAALGFWKG